MVKFLESELGLLETEPISSDVPQVEDRIAFQLIALERLEARLGAGGLSESDRPLVSLFHRWLMVARKLKETALALRASGHLIGGYDDLLRAINRSKPIAESFDYFVGLNQGAAAAAE
jgi:hypothetical protein